MSKNNQNNNTQKWVVNRECPACECKEGVAYDKLPVTRYRFGREYIQLPDQGIALVQCDNCSLIYKNIMASRSYLAQIFSRQAKNAWPDKYNFAFEKSLFKKLTGKNSFDLLDVGASSGGLLKSCSDFGGRRSGLDIVNYPNLDKYISDEFIHGLIDDYDLKWSNNPYEIVALFDVIEHAYKPYQAFRNIFNLLKDSGYAVIETGDADSAWPKKYGISNWWYVNLIEHHIFWTEKSLRFMAEQIGHEIIHIVRKTHKAFTWQSGILHLKNLWKVGLYKLFPDGYRRIAKTIGIRGIQPWCLYSKNHLLAVLKKSR